MLNELFNRNWAFWKIEIWKSEGFNLVFGFGKPRVALCA